MSSSSSSTSALDELPKQPRRRSIALSLLLAITATTAAILNYATHHTANPTATPSRVSLDVGAIFVQQILNTMTLNVDQIHLVPPPHDYEHLHAGLSAIELVISVDVDCLPFGGGPLGAVKATLASNEMLLEFRGRYVGTISTLPVQLGGGGKMHKNMLATFVVDSPDAFRELAEAAVFEDDFTVELSSVLAIELRGQENGCFLRKEMCATVGSFRIDGVKFASSVALKGAQGLVPKLANFRLSDLPSPLLAGDALIQMDATIDNPSSFVFGGLDEVIIDVHTDFDQNDGNLDRALGVKFATVATPEGFALPRGTTEWFTISGSLEVNEREHDLIETARVFDNFLRGNSTMLIVSIKQLKQPFYQYAAEFLALRAPLPGLVKTKSIVQMVHVALDVPFALASLSLGAVLKQGAQIEVLNPLDSSILVMGLVAGIYYNGVHVGDVDMPNLGDESFLVPPLALYRTSTWITCELNGDIVALASMLKTMLREPALVELDSRLTIRVAGAEPILTFRQENVKVALAIDGPAGEISISGRGEHLDVEAGLADPSPPPPPASPPPLPPKSWFG